MPADSSIYGMIRQPEFASPAQGYVQAAQIKHMLDSSELSALQRQQLQQSISDDQSVRAAFANMKPGQTIADILPDVMKASPKAGIAMQSQLLTQKKTEGDIGKTQVETHALQIKSLRDQLATVQDDAGLAAVRDSATKLYGPQVVANMPQSVNDPNFSAWREKQVMDATAFLARVKPEYSVQDFGGTKGVVQANPNATGGVTGLQAKTMTPGERASNAIAAGNLGVSRARATFEGVPLPAVGGAGGPVAVFPASPQPAAPANAPRGAAALPVPAPAAAQQAAIPLPQGIQPNTKAAQEYTVKLAAEKPRDLTALEDNAAALDQAIEQAKATLRHPGLSMATGMTGTVAARVPGTDAYDANAKLTTLKGQVMLGLLKQMKSISPTGASGFGQLSNAEGDTLRNSLTNLENAQSEPQIKEALTTAINAMTSAKDRLLRGYTRIYGEQPQIKTYENIPPPDAQSKIGTSAPTRAEIDAELRRRKVIR